MLYKLHILIILIIISISVVSSADDSKGRIVYVVKISGTINPSASEFVTASLKKANDLKAEVVIIELDTPGGLDTSMRQIVKDIVSSPIPVVVYVSPSGARAASAGAFITIAAHIAVMAPGTNIGAAHPVAVGEKMDKTVAEKAENDAAAYIRSLAESHNRNADWAEKAVRQSASITETEALRLKVIDLISEDINTLLKAIDGKEVKTAVGQKKINTAGATIVRNEMGVRHKILDFISDPNVAYMLMLIGFYGIFFELTNPGSIFPGVIGAICLILAFYSFQTLPVNYAGLLLILVGIILFLLEIKVVSYGLLTVGGIASIILGSLMLFDSPDPLMRVSLSIIIPFAIVSALFFILTFRLAYKAYKRTPVTGMESMIGADGIAKTNINDKDGLVLVQGEIWSARSDEAIQEGSNVTVIGSKGMVLKVKKA
ncbi:MAG: nodulation protein NfeD [Thermodesulfovibrionales bacterium]|nr:nodulation protein NfeD [Thermodesulfovibrionales bacterium]